LNTFRNAYLKLPWFPFISDSIFFFHGARAIRGSGLPNYRGFPIIIGNTTFHKNSVHEWPGRRSDLYLTRHNTHKRQTFMPPRDSNPKSQQACGRRPTP
jgi:hypothetical protein